MMSVFPLRLQCSVCPSDSFCNHLCPFRKCQYFGCSVSRCVRFFLFPWCSDSSSSRRCTIEEMQTHTFSSADFILCHGHDWEEGKVSTSIARDNNQERSLHLRGCKYFRNHFQSFRLKPRQRSQAGCWHGQRR